ncbi:MAG: glycosyltransferase family 1 protein [Thermoplasmata archaeon]|nr:MAG: glycosyltransferase family 1 protein [Thermoplasmata archaeon]
MNILIVNWKDIRHPEAGGAEVYTHEICKRIVEMGHNVTLFASKYNGAFGEEEIDGIRIVRDGGRFGVYLKVKNFYKHNNEFDIVVDEVNTRPFMTVDFIEKPKICLIHQLAREFWFYKTPFPINYIGRYLLEDKWLSKYRDIKTVTVSDSTKKDLLELGFKDVEIVYNGLSVEPLEEISEKEEEFTVLFIGRLTPTKKPFDAIKAFKLAGIGKLWIVGRGELENILREEVSEDVKFYGYVSEEEKYDLMKRAHVVLVPGLREGWGRVVIEANAMGTPAIGYDIPGLRDSIRDGETGILCRPTIESMAEKIRVISEDEDLREKLSKNALKWSKNFSWDKSSERFFEILRKAAG